MPAGSAIRELSLFLLDPVARAIAIEGLMLSFAPRQLGLVCVSGVRSASLSPASTP